MDEVEAQLSDPMIASVDVGGLAVAPGQSGRRMMVMLDPEAERVMRKETEARTCRRPPHTRRKRETRLYAS